MAKSAYERLAKIASNNGLSLVCNYRYELRDMYGLLFWSYDLKGIENYLNGVKKLS